MSTTPTGIRIIACTACNHTHPEGRNHCEGCGIASVFLNAEQACLTCRERNG